MATPKRYVISLNKAEISKHNPDIYRVCYDLRHQGPRQDLTCTSLRDVLAAADKLAADHGAACHISIRCLDRKPPGFDAATKFHALFRNMEQAERT